MASRTTISQQSLAFILVNSWFLVINLVLEGLVYDFKKSQHLETTETFVAFWIILASDLTLIMPTFALREELLSFTMWSIFNVVALALKFSMFVAICVIDGLIVTTFDSLMPLTLLAALELLIITTTFIFQFLATLYFTWSLY